MEENVKFKNFIVFCLLIFFIIFISEASAEKKYVSEMDGTDWTVLPDDLYRATYVAGFIFGTLVATGEFILYGVSLEKEVLKLYIKSLDDISLSDITVGQIKDGTNVFYNDFSNRRIKIVDAIYVVKTQIKGNDPE